MREVEKFGFQKKLLYFSSLNTKVNKNERKDCFNF